MRRPDLNTSNSDLVYAVLRHLSLTTLDTAMMSSRSPNENPPLGKSDPVLIFTEETFSQVAQCALEFKFTEVTA